MVYPFLFAMAYRVFCIITMIASASTLVQALEPPVNQEHFTIISTTVDKVVNTEGIDDPIRQGTLEAAQTGGILRANVDDGVIGGDDSISTTLTVIKNAVNYTLGFMGLIALIFMIWHGFRYITQQEEETAEDAANKLKQAAIAIGGIGLSWFIVTFIFFVIRLLVR